MYARVRRARLRKTTVGLKPFVWFSLRHIPAHRKPTVCFKGGLERHIQPERYTADYRGKRRRKKRIIDNLIYKNDYKH